MKHFVSIFTLSVLMFGACSPASSPPAPTLSPSATPQPTATSQPMDTPKPTATPSAPREAGEVVQIFEGGKWVDMSTKLPESVWGTELTGVKIVLKDNVPYLQKEMENFQNEDGSKSVDVAKYNQETGSWEVVNFSVTK